MNALRTPLYRAEFGDRFDNAEAADRLLHMGFEDRSWHNDVCPSFAVDTGRGSEWVVFVDFKDPELREMGPDGGAFSISEQNSEGPLSDGYVTLDSIDAVLEYITANSGEGKRLTLEEFRATRTECADLGAALPDECFEDANGNAIAQPGLIYCGALHIERCEDGEYLLHIARDEYKTADLAALEVSLYWWAGGEGYLDATAER